MKKIIFIFLILTHTSAYAGENYAILISLGTATEDTTYNNSEFWYDLFLTYEDLIIEQGFTHENVFVFYGDDGEDWTETIFERYKKEYHGWTEPIVDFDNSYETVNQEIGKLANIITDQDILHIRLVVAHAGPFPPTNPDEYFLGLVDKDGLLHPWATLQQTLDLFNQINNYKKRKIFWMTCFAGCVAEGELSFNNEKTTIITSSQWYQGSFYCPHDDFGHGHACFNYVITSCLYGEDPLGEPPDHCVDCFRDGVLSLLDLWTTGISSQYIMGSTPALGDIGMLAGKIFITENLILEDVDLDLGTSASCYYYDYECYEYWVETMKVRNVNIKNNSNVIFEIGKEIEFEKNFEVELGSTIEVINK